jgi:hypothetical protein
MLAPTGPGLAAQNAIVAGATPPIIAANLTVLADTLGTYLPWGLWLLAPVGYLVLTRRNSRFGVAVLWALVAFIVPWLVLSRGSPSRYYLAAMPYVCGLVALALASLADVLPASHGRWGRTLVFLPPAAALAVLLAFSARLVLDFDHAALSVQDDWAYRSGWPSGYMYAEASRFIATTAGPETAVAYVVDDQHRIAMGLYRRQADGFALAGPLLLDPRIAPALRGADYVVVDDTRYEQPGERLASLRALAPELSELAHFTNPDSRAGVSVLAVARRATGQSRSRRRPGPGTRGR